MLDAPVVADTLRRNLILELDSDYPLQTFTKVFTAGVAMMLVEDGLLGLNRPVVDYVPELCGEGTKELLVHHLLTHTSGFQDIHVTKWRYKHGRDRSVPLCEPTQHPVIQDWLHRAFDAPVLRPPGELQEYCTHNYILRGEVLRRVSGRSLADTFDERILRPLDMHSTWLVVPESARPQVVRRPLDAPMAAPEPWGWQGLDTVEAQETPWPDRGLFSTARDFAVFAQTILNGGTYGSTRLFSRRSVEAMTTNQVPPGTRAVFHEQTFDASWGYGWVTSPRKFRPRGSLPAPGSVSHGGAGGAALWIDRENEIVGVFLEVLLRQGDLGEPLTNCDLFQNAVTAAVSD